jgi:sugar O-acyltransferase (sialic acid O-acetyltransferase NeuD family)
MSTSTKQVLILGASGACRDVISMIKDINLYGREKIEILGILDDNSSLWGSNFFGILISGPLSSFSNFNSEGIYGINALSSEKTIKKLKNIIDSLNSKEEKFINLIHPSVSISDYSNIGFGNIIYPGVRILSNVKIGNFVTILSNSVINHDSSIQSYSVIASGVMISGYAKIANNVFLGSGSTIKPNINVEEFSVVGMGSVVVRDVKSGTTVVGIPATALKKN